MRKWMLVGVVLAMLGGAATAGAEPIWLPGVSEAGGWKDVNKTWTDDNLLCWAAAASNILDYTRWIGTPNLGTSQLIFDDFIAHWDDRMGNTFYGVEWWMTGVNERQGQANWAQVTEPVMGFYTDALFTANRNFFGEGYVTLDRLSNALTQGRGTEILIRYGAEGCQSCPRHALTLWGINPTLTFNGFFDIWVTDSDDNVTALQNFHVNATGFGLDGRYDDWAIGEIFALLPNSQNIEPMPRALPEPATLVLVGTGVAGLLIRRKRR